MECKFLKHGIAIDYQQIVKPCCNWQITPKWRTENFVGRVNLSNWHQTKEVQVFVEQLDNNQWPGPCSTCQRIESTGRFDSMRGNGNQAYSHYDVNDLTLEIRPGNVCNFACQTCWPEASSRVKQYQIQAGIIHDIAKDPNKIDNFNYLLPVVHRIKNVILLGGEPFYDKNCLNFLHWAEKNLNAELTIFTNGSAIDYDFINNYTGSLNIVFSLDAAGKAAEYIRYGTEWTRVIDNYLKIRNIRKVGVRVNVTCSVYNYMEIANLFSILKSDWPDIITFGDPHQPWLRESVIPVEFRNSIIESLQNSIEILHSVNIEKDQQSNATNAIQAIINNLFTLSWSSELHSKFCNFVSAMDTVKKISIAEYVPSVAEILSYQPNQI